MRTRIILIVVALLLLAPVIGIGVLLYTELGVNLIAGQLGRLERFGVTIDGLSGTLAGPLRIERFELNHPRVHAIAHGIVIEPQLRGLLLQTIQTSSLTVRESQVEMRQVTLPPSTRPPRFVPSFLRIDARGVELANVRYVHLNGTVVNAKTIRTRVTATSSRLHAQGFEVDADLFDATGELRLRAAASADLPMGVQGSANGQVHLTDTELTVETVVDGTLDRLDIKAKLLQPNVVNIDAVMTRPDNSWNIAGHVTSAQFLIDPWLKNPPLSFRDIALDVEANPNEIHAQGTLGVPELDEKDLTLDARGRYADRTLYLASSDIQLQDSPGTLHTKGKIMLDGGSPTLDLTAQWETLQWPLRGTPVVTSSNGDGTLRGPLPYDFAVTASIDGPNLPPSAGSATGVLTKEQVTIASYAVNALEGSLSGNGELQFALPRAWRVSTQAIDVNPAGLFKDFAGRISMKADASGQGFDKHATFAANIGDLRGTLRGERIQGRVFV